MDECDVDWCRCIARFEHLSVHSNIRSSLSKTNDYFENSIGFPAYAAMKHALIKSDTVIKEIRLCVCF
jgi:hypothetical protein